MHYKSEQFMKNIIKNINFILYTLLCIGVTYYAFNYFFQLSNPQNSFQLKLANSGWIAPMHFIFGGIALLITPFQISQKLRRLSIRWHRKIGYLYATAVLLSGTAGLLMALKATGGWIAQLGFFSLAVLWLSTTTLAVIAAIKGDIKSHKRWIFRSVALTAAAITLRLCLGIGLGVLHLPFLTVYVPTAWLCWTINIVICEWVLWRQWKHNKINREPLVV